MLVEGAPPEVMDGEAKDDHLEGVSLLSASLAPGVKHVPAKVEVTQVRFGGAQGLEVVQKYENMLRSSVQTVSILSPSLSPQAQSQEDLPPRTSRVSRRHRTLKALDMSNLITTSGSEGSELSETYMAERILAQWHRINRRNTPQIHACVPYRRELDIDNHTDPIQ